MFVWHVYVIDAITRISYREAMRVRVRPSHCQAQRVVTWAPAHARPAASHQKPRPMTVEFFVTAALGVRKVASLDAATAGKWLAVPSDLRNVLNPL